MAILNALQVPGGDRSGSSAPLMHAVDLESTPEAAFALICEVEKWPVWLSFLRSVRLADPAQPVGRGSEVIVRSSIPGETEQLYEVDQFIDNHMLSLVGAYSVRRRLDFRIERKTTRSKMAVRLHYPAYGGRIAALVDGLTSRRKLGSALEESLVRFKGLVEYRQESDALLADF
ncbi:MAG: hypothetical protein NVS1B14_08520 [Vulcanimicrobiaceae bacterium]